MWGPAETVRATPVVGLTSTYNWGFGLTNVLSATARTVTVTYAGDAYYFATTMTILVDYGKRRSSRH